MNSTEDRLRAAARAAADTVPPGSAPPLHLPAAPGHRRGHLRRHVTGMPVAAPVAAAVAVAAVVTLSLVVTSGSSRPGTGHAPGGPGAASVTPSPTLNPTSSPPPSPPPGPAAQAVLASIPPYYVALTGYSGQQQHAVIRATATGAVVATVPLPQPYGTFSWVSAAADGRTFALAAQPWRNTGGGTDSSREPTKFFLLRLDAAGHPVRGITLLATLAPLPMPAEPSGVWVDGIAFSPDGTKLAVAADSFPPQSGVVEYPENPKIVVYSVATGSATQWEWPGTGLIGNDKPLGSPLSLAADGRTLAFQFGAADGTVEVRLCSTQPRLAAA